MSVVALLFANTTQTDDTNSDKGVLECWGLHLYCGGSNHAKHHRRRCSWVLQGTRWGRLWLTWEMEGEKAGHRPHRKTLHNITTGGSAVFMRTYLIGFMCVCVLSYWSLTQVCTLHLLVVLQCYNWFPFFNLLCLSKHVFLLNWWSSVRKISVKIHDDLVQLMWSLLSNSW